MLEIKNLLRQVDCQITIPYWDWSKDTKHWAQATEASDVWHPGPAGLGGLLHAMAASQMARLRKVTSSYRHNIDESCLKRNFNLSCSLPTKEKVQNVSNNENFTVFENFIRHVTHPALHGCVGVHMGRHHSAAFMPEFWIHPSFVA